MSDQIDISREACERAAQALHKLTEPFGKPCAEGLMITALRAALDAAEAEKARAVEALTFLQKVMTDNHKVSPPPHRLQIHDGSWHEGPVVDFVHDLLSVMRDYIAAAIRTGANT